MDMCSHPDFGTTPHSRTEQHDRTFSELMVLVCSGVICQVWQGAPESVALASTLTNQMTD